MLGPSAIVSAAVAVALLQTSASGSFLRRLDATDLQTRTFVRELQTRSLQATCDVENGIDFIGNDIAAALGPVESCCDKCADLPACNLWSWTNQNGGTCWLKSAEGAVQEKANVQSGILTRSEDCKLDQNLDIVGNDLFNAPSAKPEGCRDVCKNSPDCRGFSWTNLNGGTCWIKSTISNVQAKPGVISSLACGNGSNPPPPEPPSCSSVEYDVDYVGNDVGNVQAGDASQCCTLCDAKDECNAWTWSNANGGTCWLKSDKGQTAYKAGVKSAVLF